MMQTFRTEGNYRSADRLSPAELRAAIASREILQSTALAFDTQRQLRFDLGGVKAVMPFGQCADGAESGTVRDIAVLTRVGRPTCFVIEGMKTGENGQPCYLLSRAEAQRMCKAEYLDTLQPGDILPCTVTHIEPFGAFCDVGCGISALLPIDCMSVSRISSPADRVSVGQQILCAIKSRDVQGRFVLTIRERWAPGRRTPPGSPWARPWWALCGAWRNTAPLWRSPPIWPALPRPAPTCTPGRR